MNADKKWMSKDLLEINPSSTDIFNAYRFLIRKGVLQSTERATGGKRIFVGILVTDTGIDIVEGIERGRDGQREFAAMFNISAEGALSVDEFVSQHLSSLMN